MPGLRVTLSDLEPPVNVGVAPSVLPLLDSIVRLWGTGDAFVKLNETRPALAVSVVASNLSCPAGSAASASGAADVAAGGAAAGLDGVGALLAGAGVDDELLLEPPQPARAARATIAANVEDLSSMN